VLLKAKKHTKCPYCDALNGPVKKGPGLMKIVHEPFRGKRKTDPILTNALDELLQATEENKELSQSISPASLIRELNPIEVLHLFKNIPTCDIPLLGMTSEDADPKNLILTRVYVPPACIRPSVVSEMKSGT
jgi:DNA-directed RNA polymerase III subunit RPC1